VVVATKAGVVPPTPYDSSRQHLLSACEASLTRLQVERIDLFQLHRPDLLAHPAEVAAALEQLMSAGKIRAVGVSNYTAAQTRALMAHLPFPLSTIQPELSVLATAALDDGTLDLAMQSGLGVLAWSPLAQGRVTAAPSDALSSRVIVTLDEIAGHLGTTRAAVAYAWVMQHPSAPVPLIGSQRPERIQEAAGAANLRLSRGDWYRILVSSRGRPMP
jgi:predicted oxidoreductase